MTDIQYNRNMTRTRIRREERREGREERKEERREGREERKEEKERKKLSVEKVDYRNAMILEI